MSGVRCDLRMHSDQESIARDCCSISLLATRKRRFVAQDSKGNKTVVREQLLCQPCEATVHERLPVSLADLEGYFLPFLAAEVECPVLLESVAGYVRDYIQSVTGGTRDDLITEEFWVGVHVDLYTEEEVEDPLVRVRAAINKLDKVEGSSASAGTCAICLDDLSSDRLIKMPCDHVFHGCCIVPWLETSPTCPFCRRELE